MKALFLSILFVLLSSSLGLAETKYMTKYGYYACTRISDYHNIHRYAQVKDDKAIKILIDNERCVILESVVEVQIMRYGSPRNIVNIRVIGTETTVWTTKEALIPIE